MIYILFQILKFVLSLFVMIGIWFLISGFWFTITGDFKLGLPRLAIGVAAALVYKWLENWD